MPKHPACLNGFQPAYSAAATRLACVTGLLAPQVWPKYLDFCFFITYGVTLILSYTISETFVHRWLQVITQGGVFVLISV